MTAIERRVANLGLQFAIPSDAGMRTELSDRELRVLLIAAFNALFIQRRDGSVNTPGLKTNVVVANISSAIVPANGARTWLCIVNTGAEAISLGFGVAAEEQKGITLSANGGTFVMDANNLYRGQINGIASVESSVGVQEFTR